MSDPVANAIDLVIEQLDIEGFPEDMTFSLIFSRITREARRVYGLRGAQKLLTSYVMPATAIDADLEVKVPDAHFRMGPIETAVSDLVRSVINGLRLKFGDEMAFRIMLTRTIRAAERVYGDAPTQQLLRGLIDTMPEAAQYDRS